MVKCCICGKEANHHALGLGWCEKHYEKSGVKTKKLSTKEAGGRVKASIDLNLERI